MPRTKYLIEGWRPDRARHDQNESGCRSLEGLVPTGQGTFREAGGLSTVYNPMPPKNIRAGLFVNTGEIVSPTVFDGVYLAGNDGSEGFATGTVTRDGVDITPASITTHADTVGELEWADMALYGRTVLLTDGLSPLWGSDGTQFAPIITSTTKPRFYLIDAIGDFALGAHCTFPADDLNPLKIWWSDIGDPANWEPDPSAGLAGFAYIRHRIGMITGLAGFPDFALVFGSLGVVRLQVTGTQRLFDQQYIAGPDYGTYHPKSIVACGPDVYYLSNNGFAVIRDGGRPEKIAIGKTDRQLFQGAATELHFGNTRTAAPWQYGIVTGGIVIYSPGLVWGALDSQSGNIVWTAGDQDSDASPSNKFFGSYAGISYSPFADEWTVLWDGRKKSTGAAFYGDTDELAPALCLEWRPAATGAISSILFPVYDDTASTNPKIMSAQAFTSDGCCRIRADSLIWSVAEGAEPQSTVRVTGVRPIFRNSDKVPVEITPVPPPDFTVYVKGFFELPARDEEIYDWSAAVGSDDADADGFIRNGDLPLCARYFVFRLFREGSASAVTEMLTDLVGFDIEWEPD